MHRMIDRPGVSSLYPVARMTTTTTKDINGNSTISYAVDYAARGYGTGPKGRAFGWFRDAEAILEADGYEFAGTTTDGTDFYVRPRTWIAPSMAPIRPTDQVWACCTSNIGPICQHRRVPVETGSEN